MNKKFGEHSLCLVGGGDFMRTFAYECLSHEIPVKVLLVKESAHEQLVLADFEFLGDERLAPITTIVENPAEIAPKLCNSDVVIAFGSRWIFPKDVLEKCDNKIFNLNLIPIPNYLGAAHFSWQILNEDKSGGINLQQITMQIDRGPIYYQHNFIATNVDNPVPLDYFEGYASEISAQFHNIVDAIFVDKSLSNARLLDPSNIRYYPGLRTLSHGHINWDWDVEDVDRFIRAFDLPYPGAFGLLPSGNRLHLRSPVIIERCEIHPFCAGLVVAHASDEEFILSVKGGYIQVRIEPQNSVESSLPKLGSRLS